MMLSGAFRSAWLVGVCIAAGVPAMAEEPAPKDLLRERFDSVDEAEVEARTTTAAAEVPQSVFFDAGLNTFTTEGNAGRVNFWQLFSLLVSPDTFTRDEGGALRLSTAPSRYFQLTATLAEPKLRDKVKDAFDDAEQDAALNGLTVFDDVWFEANFNIAPGDRGGGPRLISEYIALGLNSPEYIDSVNNVQQQVDSLAVSTPSGRAWRNAQLQKVAAEDEEFEQRRDRDALREAVKALKASDGSREAALALLRERVANRPSGEEPLIRQREIDRLTRAATLLEATTEANPMPGLTLRLADKETSQAKAVKRLEEAEKVQAAALAEFNKEVEQVPFTYVDNWIDQELIPLYRAYRNRLSGQVTARVRDADELVGQDEYGVAASLQWGSPSIPRKKRTGKEIAEWLAKRRPRLDGMFHSFSFEAAWTRKGTIENELFPAIDQEKFEELSGAFNWTTKVFRNQLNARIGKDKTVPNGADLSFTARYIRPSEDFANKRVTANATLTLHIPGAPFTVPISVTYANKEEFIDEKVVRGFFGFSYALHNKNETAATN